MQNKLEYFFTLILWIILIFESTGGLTSTEYCQWQNFNASCPPGQVINIKWAEYGRMRIGNCITQAFGYIGCKYDAREYLDNECSGQPKCQLSIPIKHLEMMEECPSELKGYLNADYSCLAVTRVASYSCKESNQIVLKEKTGFLSSWSTEMDQVGSVSCPWVIKGVSGQKINLTLIDFSVWQRKKVLDKKTDSYLDINNVNDLSHGYYHIYATVRERSSNPFTIVGGTIRESIVYTSETETVEIEINLPPSLKAQFVIRYEIFGCITPEARHDVTITRDDNTLYVKCKMVDQQWTLKCDDGNWVGENLTCTIPETWALPSLINNSVSLPQGLLIAMILGTALLIALIIVAVGLYVIKRKTNANIPQDRNRQKSGQCDVYDSSYGKERYPMVDEDIRSDRSRPYASTWGRRMGVPTSLDLSNYPDAELEQDYPFTHYSRNNSIRNPRHSNIDHIYESPKFLRKDYRPNEQLDLPYYHELEPEESVVNDISDSMYIRRDLPSSQFQNGDFPYSQHSQIIPGVNSSFKVGNMSQRKESNHYT